MTMLDKFVSFAQALPPDRREAIEDVLASLMQSFSAQHDFNAAELAELDRRVAEPSPKYADAAAVDRLFRRSPGK